jgi:hypothetical protein
LLTHPTLDQLRALGLFGMAKAFGEIEASGDAATLNHAEWLRFCSTAKHPGGTRRGCLRVCAMPNSASRLRWKKMLITVFRALSIALSCKNSRQVNGSAITKIWSSAAQPSASAIQVTR